MPLTLTDYVGSRRGVSASAARMESRGALAARGGRLLDPERWELIGGDLFRKMPKKRRHVQALAILTEWFVFQFGGRLVNTEAPINVAPEDNPSQSRS